MMVATEDCEIGWWPYSVKNNIYLRPPFAITDRTAVALISVISIVSCIVDMLTSEDLLCCCHYPIIEHIDSLRKLLLSFFQLANLLLLLATFMENPLLVHVYVWYVLAFVMLGLAVSLTQFLMRVPQTGVKAAVLAAMPEVAFLFVIFRCLPLVDKYGRELTGK